MIEWVDVRASKNITQDVNVTMGRTGDTLLIAIKRGAWITKLHRADKIAVGFATNNGVPTAMYFAPSSAGYSVVRKDSGASTVGITLRLGKIATKYPRLKVSELQGDYILREDQNEKACFISLGAKAY